MFQVLAKPAGPACNLDCSYCFYLEKDQIYPNVNNFKMTPEVLESFIQQKIESTPLSTIQFSWQGGEPTLLGLDFFKEVVRIQQKYGQGRKIENNLQTNGVLLDNNWCQFFADMDFLIGISVDGPAVHNDTYRMDKLGRGSLVDTLNGLDRLKKYGVNFNTLTVVNASNVDQPDEIYTFLKSLGSTHWQFIPVVERLTPKGSLATPDDITSCPVAPWSVDPVKYGQFLDQIFQRWVRNDVGTIYIQHFEAALANQLRMNPGVCVWSETCGRSLAVEHNGDLYPCDHYVFEEFRLGNLLKDDLADLAQRPEQLEFGRDKREKLPQVCLECEVLDLCHGECPKHRFVMDDSGKPGLNFLCPSYKHFFNAIRPELRTLAEFLNRGQAAESIMEWVMDRDMVNNFFHTDD